MGDFVGGRFNVEKCVRYLRSVGVEITDEQAIEWGDAEKTERFCRSMKGKAAEGWDWWCTKGHQNYREHRRGRRKTTTAPAGCKVCGGGLRSGHVRWTRTRDGVVRDYRPVEDQWRALDWEPAPMGDEPDPIAGPPDEPEAWHG